MILFTLGGSIRFSMPPADSAAQPGKPDNCIAEAVLSMPSPSIGAAFLLQSRTGEAIAWLEKARSANPELPYVHSYLASVYALGGETDRSANGLAEARRLSLDGRYSSIARLQAASYFGVPKIHALYEATYFAGLRQAGMPEE